MDPNSWSFVRLYFAVVDNYVAYLFDRSKPVSVILGILSILIDYSIMEKIPTALKLPSDYIKMLYAVHPLSNLQCVTCSSSLLATALLLHTPIHPLLIAICFWETPLNYHGVLSYLLQDSHSAFVPFLMTVVVGVTIVPLLINRNRSFVLLYFSLLFYPKGFHSISIALCYLYLNTDSAISLFLSSMIAFSISLYNDLRVNGSDVYAMQYYVNCATFLLFSLILTRSIPIEK